jgi:hypothetical protein
MIMIRRYTPAVLFEIGLAEVYKWKWWVIVIMIIIIRYTGGALPVGACGGGAGGSCGSLSSS